MALSGLIIQPSPMVLLIITMAVLISLCCYGLFRVASCPGHENKTAVRIPHSTHRCGCITVLLRRTSPAAPLHPEV